MLLLEPSIFPSVDGLSTANSELDPAKSRTLT